MQNKPITMLKDTLQEMVYMRIAMTDEDSKAWEQLNAILLSLLGVIDAAGNLAPEYAGSPMWTLTDDNVLMPSVIADMATKVLGNDLSADHITQVLGTLAGMEDAQAQALHEWLGELGSTAKG